MAMFRVPEDFQSFANAASAIPACELSTHERELVRTIRKIADNRQFSVSRPMMLRLQNFAADFRLPQPAFAATA